MSYIMRLDDASNYRDISKWNRIEELFDKYNIKPLVGVIPLCKDESLIAYGGEDESAFWQRVKAWTDKGWVMAMHGFCHLYNTQEGGINPVHDRSEFAGLPLEEQERMISEGWEILKKHGICPKVFFAPSHTLDDNTLEALKNKTDIRIISDTAANDRYSYKGFTFVPQQSGCVRKLPFKVTTFCYHPNIMEDRDFQVLEDFLSRYSELFVPFETVQVSRKKGIVDIFVNKLYFLKRKLR